MNTKRQLLHQQMQQKEVVTKEENSDKAAAILVNNLLMQGFHITAPGSKESLSSDLLLPQKNTDEEDEKVTKERQILINAFHKELVRVKAEGGTDG